MINVIGLGYIGLPTALMFAAHGLEVVGTDSNSAVVDELVAGNITFKEDGLKPLFDRALAGSIRFSTDYQIADTYIVSVPTPYDKETKKIDASIVCAAVSTIVDVCSDGATIIIESTVSPGTIDRCVRPLLAGRSIDLVHAPERIIPGKMMHELIHNARTIGADNADTAQRVRQLYSSFCVGEITTTDIRTAELTKVVENTFRDINIAFANELARLCHEAELDVYEVIRIANMHPRVNILNPGPGVGGHCISVDPWFLVGDYPETVDIIRTARHVNDTQPSYVLHRIKEVMAAEDINDISRVGLYGLAYKEDVDDTRESPSLRLLELLGDDAARIQTYDPHVDAGRTQQSADSLSAFLERVDMVVIMVGHDQIRESMQMLAGKVILDTRHICDLPGVHSL